MFHLNPIVLENMKYTNWISSQPYLVITSEKKWLIILSEIWSEFLKFSMNFIERKHEVLTGFGKISQEKSKGSHLREISLMMHWLLIEFRDQDKELNNIIWILSDHDVRLNVLQQWHIW